MADIGIGHFTSVPLPRIDVARRIENWLVGVMAATWTQARTRARPSEPRQPYRHPRREVFLEDAAMSREMFRL